MAKGKSEPKDIKSETKWSAGKKTFQDGQKSEEIRVVDWIINGKHYVKLEKRGFFMSEGGEWRMSKASGFSLKDMEMIQDNWGEIMSAFGANYAAPAGGKAEAAAPAPAAAAAAEDDF